MRRLTNEEFIEKSKKITNNIDYSLLKYISNRKDVTLICKIHNHKYEQNAGDHLNGQCGCCYCNNKRKDKNTIIKESIEVHGDLYDYSNINDYVSAHDVMIVFCNKHGNFNTTPNIHITKKCACKKCSDEKQKLELDIFIKESNEIHNYDYDYSLVEYKNSHTRVNIICKKHSYIFKQTPSNHRNLKQGCPICGNIKRRLASIKYTEEKILHGYPLIPNFNKDACKVFDEISLKENIHIQHAMNGGEYYIEELGYWLDGYDKENNIAYEFDEKYHETQKQKEKDIIRQNDIEQYLKCSFIRIK